MNRTLKPLCTNALVRALHYALLHVISLSFLGRNKRSCCLRLEARRRSLHSGQEKQNCFGVAEYAGTIHSEAHC